MWPPRKLGLCQEMTSLSRAAISPTHRHTSTCTRMHKHRHTGVHIQVHTHKHTTRTHTYTQVCTHMHKLRHNLCTYNERVHTHKHMHKCISSTHMHKCAHTCTSRDTPVHIYECTHTQTHAQVHSHMHTGVHTCTSSDTPVHIYESAHTSALTQACTQTHTPTCTQVQPFPRQPGNSQNAFPFKKPHLLDLTQQHEAPPHLESLDAGLCPPAGVLFTRQAAGLCRPS